MQHLIANKAPNFSENQSTSAKIIASLARSPENMKCPLLATFRYVTVKVQKKNIFKVCVQNIFHVLEGMITDVKVTA